MKPSAVPDVDLSGLDNFKVSDFGQVRTPPAAGKPVRIPVDQIEEDPENARTDIDWHYIREELAPTIAADKRVKEAISVRSPGANGKHRLNSGYCRWQASKFLGLPDIPAVIDDDWSEDDRFVVNIQRSNLTPMDQARYLARRLPVFGGNRSELAARLGKSPAYVTQHLALLKLAPPIQELYDKGISRNATALYQLQRLHGKDAALVESAIEGVTEIGAAMLDSLEERVKAKKDSPNGGGEESAPAETKAKSKRKKTAAADAEQATVRILLMHGKKRYELLGTFVTPMKAKEAGRVYIRKGSDKPIAVNVKELTLDTIIVK